MEKTNIMTLTKEQEKIVHFIADELRFTRESVVQICGHFLAALPKPEPVAWYDEDYGAYHVQEFNGEKVVAALALPNDTTALNKLLAEVYEECAKVCKTSDRYRGDYFAAKIRALAKQKGITNG